MINGILGFALGWVSANIASNVAPMHTKKWWAIAIGLGIFGNVLANVLAVVVRA